MGIKGNKETDNASKETIAMPGQKQENYYLTNQESKKLRMANRVGKR